MAILNFSDVLKKAGLDPKRVKLIRHSLADKEFSKCYKKNMVLEYTRVQSSKFSSGYDYWCVFVSGKSTTARFFACYKVNGCIPDTQDAKPARFPLEDWFQEQRMFYNLEHVDLLKEYEGRLLIEWGKGALAWAQKGTNEKPIVAIQDKHIFSGYENFVLTYDELKEIVNDPMAHESWHTALSSINAVYLIVDRENGRQYVGSAYGSGGLLGRCPGTWDRPKGTGIPIRCSLIFFSVASERLSRLPITAACGRCFWFSTVLPPPCRSALKALVGFSPLHTGSLHLSTSAPAICHAAAQSQGRGSRARMYNSFVEILRQQSQRSTALRLVQ